MGVGDPDKNQVKLDAWRAKKFCVLIKRKYTRGQAPRSLTFAQMLAILDNQDWYTFKYLLVP